MLISDPLFYLAAIPAIFLFGIAKGGFGGGLGVVSVPIMSLVISPVEAAAILLPLLCAVDLIGLWTYRFRWDYGNLIRLIPWAILGIIIGTYLFQYLSTHIIKIILGLIAISFTCDYWLKKYRNTLITVAKPSRLWGGIAGTIGGFTSFVAHSGGPPINMYLLPQRLHRTQFVATTMVLFTVMNYVKLVPYTFLGLFDTQNILTSFTLFPFTILGFFTGVWLHKNVSDDLFYRVCYVFLFIVGVKLLFDGIVTGS